MQRIVLANETWIDEMEPRGKNGVKVPQAWVIRAMSKFPQNRFSRLVVVSSSKVRQRKQAVRWWSTKRPGQASSFPSQVTRMAVMPTLSRNVWLAGLVWLGNRLRSYLVNPRPRGAVLLSFPGKKPSGSVHWNPECDVAPQGGGRA